MAKTAERTGSARRVMMTTEKARDHLRRRFDGRFPFGRRRSTRTAADALTVLCDALDTSRRVIDLTASVMSARHEAGDSEEQFHAFERMLHRDYREFARNENFPREADASDRLQHVFAHMHQIRLAPHLASRNICAVAGGFSSGKSSLLNRLAGDDDLLPTALTPTTSIPTYLSYGEANEVTIRVFNRSGGCVPVDRETLKQMTYGFGTIDGHRGGIPLRPVVDRVSVLTPRLRRWSKVAFVDTPGYTNPGDVGDVAQDDEDVAGRELLASRFLIWVVDCEHGELPEHDIQFIRRFAKTLADPTGNGKRERPRQDAPPIYVVLNKADRKAPERNSILRHVAATAEQHELPCFGVGLYSAHNHKWYGHDGDTFEKYLEMIHEETNRVALDAEVESVFDDYIEFHRREAKHFQDTDGLLRRLKEERDGDEDDGTGSRLSTDLRRHIDYVTRQLDSHRRAADESRSLQNRFVQCTRAFMESVADRVCGNRSALSAKG